MGLSSWCVDRRDSNEGQGGGFDSLSGQTAVVVRTYIATLGPQQLLKSA